MDLIKQHYHQLHNSGFSITCPETGDPITEDEFINAYISGYPVNLARTRSTGERVEYNNVTVGFSGGYE